MDNVLFIPTQASLARLPRAGDILSPANRAQADIISLAYRAQADILSPANRAQADIISLAYRAHSWPKMERGGGDLSQPLLTLL